MTFIGGAGSMQHLAFFPNNDVEIDCSSSDDNGVAGVPDLQILDRVAEQLAASRTGCCQSRRPQAWASTIVRPNSPSLYRCSGIHPGKGTKQEKKAARLGGPFLPQFDNLQTGKRGGVEAQYGYRYLAVPWGVWRIVKIGEMRLTYC